MTDLYGNIPISDKPSEKTSPSRVKKTKKSPQSPHPKDKKTKPKGKGKYFAAPIILVALLISYYGLTTLFIPYYLEKKFPSLFQEKTGLSLAIGDAYFNPLKSALILNQINISTISLNSENTDLLTIENCYVDFDFTAVFKKAIVSESIQVKGAELTITKYEDSTYNISRFLPQDENTPSEFVNLKTIPYLYSLNNIFITDSKILFDDLSNKKSHHVDNIQLSFPTIANFSFDIDNYIQPEFSADINGSPVKLTSNKSPSTAGTSDDASKLSLSLQSIDLPTYASYIPVQLPVNIQRGNANIQVEIAFKAQQNENFRLQLDYQAQIEDGLFESTDKAAILETPALHLEGSIMPLEKQIEMRKVFFKDPIMTIRDTLSASTISSLLLENENSESTDGDFLQSAVLNIQLLIADNGKIFIRSKEKERAFQEVQLSVKNFANTRALLLDQDTRGNSSFRLSGLSSNDSSSFSWQGSFNKTIPVGDLEVNKLPADDLFNFLAPDKLLTVKGSADIRGKLSINRSQHSPLNVTLNQGSVHLSSFSIDKEDVPILQSSKAKFSPIQILDNSVNLGNIFLEDAVWEPTNSDSQNLLDIFNKKNNTSLQGIDFKGKIILNKNENKKTIEMQNVQMQINGLEEKKHANDNFVFSADVGQKGSLSAKGRLSLKPLNGVVEIAAANMPATAFFSPADIFGYTLPTTTLISANGTYNCSSEIFLGTAEISKGDFHNSQQQKSYTFAKAVLGKVSIDKKTKSFSGEDIVLKDLGIGDKSYELETEGFSLDSFSITENEVKMNTLELAKTELVIQEDFSQFLSSLQKEDAPSLKINNFHIFGSVYLNEKDKKKTKLIKEFDISTKPDKNSESVKHEITLQMNFADKGIVSGNGTLEEKPLQAQIDFELNEVSSEILQYFASSLGRSHFSTNITGKVNYSYPDKIYSGAIRMSPGQLSNESNTTLFSWQRLDLKTFTFKDKPFTLVADNVLFESPQTTFSSDNTPAISQMIKNTTEYLQELYTDNQNAGIAEFKIDRIEINDGKIEYSSPGISTMWAVNLTSVNGFINNFHLNKNNDPITYSLQGSAGDGSFTLNGDFSPSANDSKNNISFKLSSFPLNSLKEQLNALFDVDFAKSHINLKAEKETIADEFIAELALTDLEIEDPESPAALTLALLSESKNKLSTSIPLKNNSQSLFNQVTNYFQKLIVKCSVSPYLLLEWPFDTLGNRNSVTFAPGKNELNFDSRDTLLDYTTLLERHPRLQLKLNSSVQRSADTIALKKLLATAEQKRVQKENDKLFKDWQQRQLNTNEPPVSEENIIVEDISENELAAFTPLTPKTIVVTDAMLRSLGVERAEAIRTYILDQSTISDDNIASNVDVSIIDTLDMPEIHIELGHIGQD